MSSRKQDEIFKDIYEKEADTLFRFVLSRISDREKALELTQETFTRLWQAVSRDTKLENPRAFIYKVARNMVIDWYRKHKSVSLEGLSHDEEKVFDIVDEQASGRIDINADVGRALIALQELDEQYREAIYFRYFEGLEPREIAEVLGINANVVSIRITRGMDELRRLMGIDKK